MQSALSRLAKLVCLIAGVAATAVPATAHRQSRTVGTSLREVPTVHASLPSLAPVAERAAVHVASHRRSPASADTALAAASYASPTKAIAIARVRSNGGALRAAQLAARGYDATAPPRI